MYKIRKNSARRQALRLNSGQAMMVATIFFLIVSLTIILGLAGPTVRAQKMTRELFLSRQSYFLAEAGMEDVIYRLKEGLSVDALETLSLDGSTVTTVTTDIPEGKEVVATGEVNNTVRKVATDLLMGIGVSFHYGVQSGNGGLIMENTSSIVGNVYSAGPVTGSGQANNTVFGTVVSTGPAGLIDNLYATSSAYAHTIRNAQIDGDAYYQSISNTTVLGTEYPDSPDLNALPLPISDEDIEEFKAIALSGGVISSPCPYKITDEATIGPKKIACDLEISGNNFDVTINGNIWVEGNITIKNSPTIKLDPSFGNLGVAIVADKPGSPTTSGIISLENSAVFEGSGATSSHVMFISQNTSAESGGSTVAIDVKNTVSGDLLVYAGHGEILLQNSINLKEVSGYRIRLKNSAQAVYETGIANLVFDSGPSGGYEIQSWKEIE